MGATHCIKYMYMYRAPYEDELDDDLDTSSSRAELSTELEDILAISDSSLHHVEDATEMFNIPPRQPVYFNAPFFAAWFFTNFSLLFFPIYILGLVSARKCDKLSEILADVLRGFRERGFTIGMRESIPPAPAESTLSCSSRRSLSQSMPFVLHPVAGNHLPVYAFATRALCHRCTSSFCHQCCLRLFAILGHSSRAICRREGEMLCWLPPSLSIVLPSIPLQIVAVILCDTGIALLAYMDGITESRTLGGVVLATLAAAGYAVFRVSYLLPLACCVCFAVAAADVVPCILGNVPQGDG